jgi:phosphoglycolate phosphatase
MTAPTAAPTLAIFDFDGTIADSLREVLAAYNDVATGLGLATVSSAQIQQLRRLGPREAMRALQVPVWKVPRIMTAVRSAMRERMDRLEPFAGVSDTLHALWGRGCKTAIVSSNSEDNIRTFLARHGIDRFESLSCGASLFGKASRLKRMAQRPGFHGASAFYVGDELRDVAAAKQARLRSVAVSWGYGELDALQREGPDHLVHTPDELLSILTPAG